MRLTFLGAAQTVTGSKHLLSTDQGKNILLDCGLFQGQLEHIHELNRELGLEPSQIHAVVLSHAHIDHSGLIPLLVKGGFEGEIYTTIATKHLVELLLKDSAEIQMQDAKEATERARKKDPNAEEILPIYNLDDVEAALRQIRGINYEEQVVLFDDIEVVQHDAGHILGSAVTELYVRSEDKRIVFTGDLGRKGLPILKDPVQVKHADILISESTYGDRTHEDASGMEQGVVDAVQRVAETGGKLLIPAFSIGRTQEIVYVLHKLWEEKRIPEMPLYVDSPLATDATEVFSRHSEIYDRETFDEFLLKSQNPFHFKNITYTRTVEESKALNHTAGPLIIVSASGMAEAGRIVHHLKQTIDDPKNMILTIGYMAEGTLGRKIIDGEPKVMIHGVMYDVKAEVKQLHSFSAHADKDGLLEYATGIEGLKHIYLVHGEPDQMKAFAARLQERIPGTEVVIPERFDSFEV